MVMQKDEGLNTGVELGPGSKGLHEAKQDFSRIKANSGSLHELLNEVLDLYDQKSSAENKLNRLYREFIKGTLDPLSYDRAVRQVLENKDEETFFSENKNKILEKLEEINRINSLVFQGIYEYEPTITVRKQSPDISQPEGQKRTFRATPQKIEQLRKARRKKNVKKDESWSESADDLSLDKTKENKSDNLAKSLKDFFSFKKKKDKGRGAQEDSIFSDQKETKLSDTKKKKNDKEKIPFFKILKSYLGAKERSVFDKNRNIKKNAFVDNLVKRNKAKDEVLSQKTVLSDRFKNLRKIKYSVKEQSKGDLGLLSEQVKSHFNTGNSQQSGNNKSFTYDVSSYGALANVLVKDMSLELINSFPTFFKQTYHHLRLANIPILSNTYTNMMVLSSLLATGVGFVLTFLFSLVMGGSILPSFMNSLFFGIVFATITAVAFIYYPQYKISKRDQDIKTNLPFALDHMSAVVSSGVAPDSMFKLLVTSKEYGEISKEIEKIVEYIDLFGYDLVTAVETVAKLSPSDDLKEFFEGFISTVESGGNLKSFLREKSDSMMVQYKLERQKYTEIISTFSDVYTGIMVASPLFFVAALSLISILGGGVGGVDINVIVVLGTYVFIPLLNVLFMIFIEMTQPNI